MNRETEFNFPRRTIIRKTLKSLIAVGLSALANIRINGKQNLPDEGPVIVVGNHFSFLDPVALIHAVPWPIEFLGGVQMPNAPSYLTWITRVWGYYPVHRGSVSRESLLAASSILKQKGIIGIFPEGGNWATVLRPPRPGVAFLAAKTRAKILPIGFDGLPDLFPSFRKGRRHQITINIGKPFKPLLKSDNSYDRDDLDNIGHQVMRHIATLIPEKSRGYYADDITIRQAAAGTEHYPWNDVPEK